MTANSMRFHAFASALLLSFAAFASSAKTTSPPPKAQTYSDDEVVRQASEFFSTGAKELSQVLEKVLKEKGHPVAIIRGEEAGGALGVGVRYGHGELVFKGAPVRQVFWQGPSIGFDAGANAVKTFMLVYGLRDAQGLFKRFPGVEGEPVFRWRVRRQLRTARRGVDRAGAFRGRLAPRHRLKLYELLAEQAL